jgi:hypothetical protein
MPPKKRGSRKGRSFGVRAEAKADPALARTVLPLLLFCSYCHRDEKLRKQLETQLKLLQRQGVIACWHDRLIGAGQEWKAQISRNLEQAHIILLLVSADFISSDYCYDIEMTRALARHEAGEARVIPVVVRDVDLSDVPIAKLQVLPRDGRAVTLWSNRDAAWRNVVEGIKRAAEELRKPPAR